MQYYQDRHITILNADVREGLASLPDNSVHCCVTSPPYWGLRDYGIPGQLGLESTIQEYIANMVAIFDEVRRVLREDGVCFVNIGDSYASAWACKRRNIVGNGSPGKDVGRGRIDIGLKEKDLCLIPERLAISLQDGGWWIRSRICWAKKSPMPESVRDRPTSAWEHIFLLTKSSRYFYDAEAVREPAEYGRIEWKSGTAWDRAKESSPIDKRGNVKGNHDGQINPSAGRNQRNFWLLGPEPFPKAHFATFPTEIPRRAILAGSSERGCCSECGAPWERVVENSYSSHWKGGHQGYKGDKNGIKDFSHLKRLKKDVTTTGWRPTCTHDAPTVPCTVLDPFLGAGATLLVASRLGRKGIGIELNPAYCQMAVDRITADAPLFHSIMEAT